MGSILSRRRMDRTDSTVTVPGLILMNQVRAWLYVVSLVKSILYFSETHSQLSVYWCMSDLVWFKPSAGELRANISAPVATGWVDRFRRSGDQKFCNANARKSQLYFESVKQSKLLFCYINRFELHCCGILGVAFGLSDESPPSGLAIDSEISYAVLSAREETC